MTAAPDPLQQRYEAIERVYSACQWDLVARRSEELLLELPDDPGHPLRQRLQLLLGHTYLYGYEDAATASGFYSRVQAATKEPVLLDIATQGLGQCASQMPSPPTPVPAGAMDSGGLPFPFTAAVVKSVPAGSGATPAIPWMEVLGGRDPVPNLPVEVIDEPELIEVAQANPATAQELEVTARAERPETIAHQPVAVQAAESINRLSPEEIAELSKGLLRVVIRGEAVN